MIFFVVKTNSKKSYVKPQLFVEEFLPNEYVAACSSTIMSISATCARPGNSQYYCDGTEWGDSYPGSVEGYDGIEYFYHGACGKSSVLDVTSAGTGTENNGQPITNVKFGGVVDGMNSYVDGVLETTTSFRGLQVGKYYETTWVSHDPQDRKYNHYGISTIVGTPANFS